MKRQNRQTDRLRQSRGTSEQILREQQNFTIDSIEQGGWVRVKAGGAITAEDVHLGGSNPLEELLGAAWPTNRILLDLSKTEFVDSAAIGWLIGSCRECRARGGMLVAHSVTQRVRKMLELLRVGQAVPLFPSEAAARQFQADRRTASAA